MPDLARKAHGGQVTLDSILSLLLILTVLGLLELAHVLVTSGRNRH